jgi:hypothetical protein
MLSSFFLQAQNKENNQSGDCTAQITPGMNFIKKYVIDTEGGLKSKIEYSYVFTRGTTYTLHVCSKGDVSGRIPEICIYDSKRNKVATNKVEGGIFSAITFKCSSSGIFYLQYILDKSTPYNGESILSFSIKGKTEI